MSKRFEQVLMWVTLAASCNVISGAERAEENWSAADAVKAYSDSGKVPVLASDHERPSASRRFSFQAEFTLSNERKQALEVAATTKAHVAVDGDKIGALVSTSDGVPFAYMRPGLWIGFMDKEQPGVLIYIEGGHLQFMLGGTHRDTTDSEWAFGFSYGGDLEKDEVLLGIGLAFKPSFMKERQPAFYSEGREVVLMGKQGGQISVFLSGAGKGKAFGLDRVFMHSAGVKIAISEFSLDEGPAVNLFGHRHEAFAKLGIMVKPVNSTRKFQAFVRPGFPKDKDEKRMAEKLKAFFAMARDPSKD